MGRDEQGENEDKDDDGKDKKDEDDNVEGGDEEDEEDEDDATAVEKSNELARNAMKFPGPIVKGFPHPDVGDLFLNPHEQVMCLATRRTNGAVVVADTRVAGMLEWLHNLGQKTPFFRRLIGKTMCSLFVRDVQQSKLIFEAEDDVVLDTPCNNKNKYIQANIELSIDAFELINDLTMYPVKIRDGSIVTHPSSIKTITKTTTRTATATSLVSTPSSSSLQVLWNSCSCCTYLVFVFVVEIDVVVVPCLAVSILVLLLLLSFPPKSS
jgi:hypothetical protein